MGREKTGTDDIWHVLGLSEKDKGRESDGEIAIWGKCPGRSIFYTLGRKLLYEKLPEGDLHFDEYFLVIIVVPMGMARGFFIPEIYGLTDLLMFGV